MIFKNIDVPICIVFKIPKISNHVWNAIEVTINTSDSSSNKTANADNSIISLCLLILNIDPKKSRPNTIIFIPTVWMPIYFYLLIEGMVTVDAAVICGFMEFP
jgi:hypothetical protein